MLGGLALILVLPRLLFVSPAATATVVPEPVGGGQAQEPQAPLAPETPDEPDEAARLAAVDALLAAPRPEERDWRVALWEHLTQLELAPVARVLPGWQALAASGSDPDRANLVLYQRRHGLPLAPPPATGEEGPETALERCLAAWARRDFGRTQELLEQARAAFPDDDRFRQNLLWLQLEHGSLPRRAPDPVDLEADARHLALAVLAARRTRG